MPLKPKNEFFWDAYCKFGNVVQKSVLDPKKSFLSLGKFNTTRGMQWLNGRWLRSGTHPQPIARASSGAGHE